MKVILINIFTFLWACAFIGGNLYEIYGPDISMFLTEISIYSLGGISLLTAAFIYSKKQKQRPEDFND